MTTRIRLSLSLAGLLAACSLGPSQGRPAEAPPDLGVRIWAPPILRWEGEGARHVAFAIENATNRTVVLAAADPANARVEIFAGPESIRLCGVVPRVGPANPDAVSLAPGDRLAVRVDLEESCARVPAGDYRYEVSYRLPDTGRAGAVAGMLATSYGEVFVDARAAGDAVAGPDAARRVAEPRSGRRSPAATRR